MSDEKVENAKVQLVAGSCVHPATIAMTDKNADRERDEVLRRMLKTPPKPHEPLGKDKEGKERRVPRPKNKREKG